MSVRPEARLQGLRSNGGGKWRQVETTLRSLVVNRKTSQSPDGDME